MHRVHLSIAGARRRFVTRPDLALLEDVVAPKVIDAMKLASQALTNAGVRHVIVGGLAVGAHGYPRATKVIDFLVGDEAFEQHPDGVVTMRAGIPIQVHGVAIDLLSVGEGEDHLTKSLDAAPGSVAEAAPLVYLKLKSPRHKDRTDVIELVKAGIDIDSVRAYLKAHSPALLASFEAAVAQAAAEE